MMSEQGGPLNGVQAATVVKPDPIHPRARKMKVIDTDFHFTPSFEALRKYMKEPFRTKVVRYPVVGTEIQPNFATGQEGTGQNVLGEAKTGEEVLTILDQIGVDTVILDPGFPRLGGIFLPSVYSAIASAYNDFLIHEVFPVSPRLKGQIMINQREPHEAAREIRRVGGHPGFVGVYAEFGPFEPIGSAKHDPIFDAMAESQLPLTIHGAGFWQPLGKTAEGVRTWTEMLGVSWPCYAMTFAASLIMQGAFDKYPWLKVLIQEGGLWWVPELAARLDEFYLDHPGDIQLTERKLELGQTYLNRLPSDYLKEHFYLATQPMSKPKNQKHFGWLLEICDAEHRFVYSSDWPHQTFDPVNWVVDNAAISEEMQHRIFYKNAKELFARL